MFNSYVRSPELWFQYSIYALIHGKLRVPLVNYHFATENGPFVITVELPFQMVMFHSYPRVNRELTSICKNIIGSWEYPSFLWRCSEKKTNKCLFIRKKHYNMAIFNGKLLGYHRFTAPPPLVPRGPIVRCPGAGCTLDRSRSSKTSWGGEGHPCRTGNIRLWFKIITIIAITILLIIIVVVIIIISYIYIYIDVTDVYIYI